ncbi:S-adenosyl-L-methionine-dependent methyltransferase [Nadsonia fulvescens var. elongata DSM 6958]|uniref:S-adenosyl-L-methionine-dependent methyltransferase n=1 Tax=Nadsonia fulvescens var. elongata DSM 6958 TaxID=857566 RepID=A0A1E3PIS3_9ASCO|nr:S-adenosyl-L-methionine-dependent methyltransferase [Nadsonia fulvescens var. elongata DSM 6958]
MSRPEEIAPPELFYNDDESKKYTESSRVQHIQSEMTHRALELLNIPPSQYILDIGCGSGLSGEILTEEGHTWVGMDIAASMLGNALDREVEGDLFLADMGQGIPFRAGTFDAAISISVIQWLCNADSSNADPKKRLMKFFATLFASLKRGGKVVCQFYPSNDRQLESILNAAKATGFGGGVVLDNPDSKKNRKYYLVLSAGQSDREIDLTGVKVEDVSHSSKKNRKKGDESTKDYIRRKKETMRKRGRAVALDSKFTGRKRKVQF